MKETTKDDSYPQRNGKDRILELNHPHPKLFKPPLNFTVPMELQFFKISITSSHVIKKNYIAKTMNQGVCKTNLEQQKIEVKLIMKFLE